MAFDLAEKSKNPGWLIWIDADSYLKKRLTKQDMLAMLNDKADMVIILMSLSLWLLI